jgi:DNA repair photolyase
LRTRKAVTIRELPVRTALNRCDSPRMPFDLTLNPYRGCEFACVYCYARYTHTFMGLEDPDDFETIIFAKGNAPELLERELAHRDLRGQHIAMGTVTDPYQPAERTLGLTRRMLEKLARVRGLRLSITTKSDLVVRDLDLLQEIGRHNQVQVNCTVITVDVELARRLEPKAPRPDLRLGALATLRQAGIAAGVFAMPVLPALTDSRAGLTALAQAAAAAGALWLSAQPLFVRDCIRPTLYAYLAREQPDLLARYRRAYARSTCLPDSYSRRLRSRVEAIRARFGLAAGPAFD